MCLSLLPLGHGVNFTKRSPGWGGEEGGHINKFSLGAIKDEMKKWTTGSKITENWYKLG